MIFSASAPGRLDVMGGIADYSGSLVLQMPVSQHTTARLQLTDSGKILVNSVVEGEIYESFDQPVGLFFTHENTIDLDFAKQWFQAHPQQKWAAYPVGCFLIYCAEFGIQPTGIDLHIESSVPLGKGVSSSASLEMAVMKALGLAYHVASEGTLIPRLGQKAENLVVGAPCGLMDQLASYFGKPGHLLPIVCQPDRLFEPIPLPTDVHFLAIDSGVRHAVTGASYSDVRAAAFMGYSIIAKQLGATLKDLQLARNSKNWTNLPLQGFLTNMSPADFDLNHAESMPETMSGKEFLKAFEVSIDTVTHLAPDTQYKVKIATKHPVYENHRVYRFKQLLEQATLQPTENLFQEMGELMMQSHQSYSACGLGTSQTDRLVQLAIENRNKGVFGAKITGGGSGGTVCFLAVGNQGKQAVAAIHREYEAEQRKSVTLFDFEEG